MAGRDVGVDFLAGAVPGLWARLLGGPVTGGPSGGYKMLQLICCLGKTFIEVGSTLKGSPYRDNKILIFRRCLIMRTDLQRELDTCSLL